MCGSCREPLTCRGSLGTQEAAVIPGLSGPFGWLIAWCQCLEGLPCPPASVHTTTSNCKSCWSGSFVAGISPQLQLPPREAAARSRGTRHLGGELRLCSRFLLWPPRLGELSWLGRTLAQRSAQSWLSGQATVSLVLSVCLEGFTS